MCCLTFSPMSLNETAVHNIRNTYTISVDLRGIPQAALFLVMSQRDVVDILKRHSLWGSVEAPGTVIGLSAILCLESFNCLVDIVLRILGFISLKTHKILI